MRRPLVSLAAVIAALALFALPASATADLGSEVAHGQALADSLQSGQRSCGDLHADDFEAIGEYAMDRFIGNRAAHEAMNAHMVQMMGPQGERRMHIALGYRYTGCAGAQQSGWIGPMAGMMGGYGSGGGYPRGGVGQGMMGGRSYGPMMGWGFGSQGGGVSALGAVAIGVGAAILGGLLVALVLGLRGRRPGAAA
jgi:hypothetical protein